MLLLSIGANTVIIKMKTNTNSYILGLNSILAEEYALPPARVFGVNFELRC